MGAETSSLEECSLGEPVVNSSETKCEIRHGLTFENDSLITVFSEKSKKKDTSRAFERNIKFLKSLRHPYILHYIKDGKNEDRFLVTERATPLSFYLGDLSSVEVASGICNIITALSFLHDKAQVCHNNISTDSIYVAENGSWKLGGFDCACLFTEVSPDFLKSISKFRNEESIPPEENDERLNLTIEHGHVRDVYSFGVMVDGLLEHLEDLDEIIKTFEIRIHDECLNSDPKKRPKLQSFLEDKIFSNDLLSLSSFLHHVTLKSKDEREDFYSTLVPRLQSLPMDTVGKHLVKPLLCRFVLLDKTARDVVAPHILVPQKENSSVSEDITPLFSMSQYRTYVIPELYKAFCCHEINIRTLLLNYFSSYADLFDKEKLEDVIFPQILLGIRDVNEELAALSLHSLAVLIPILGRDVVIGGKSKSYFTEGLPKSPKSGGPDETGRGVNGVIGNVKLKDLVPNSHLKSEKKTPPIERKSREERMKEQKERREQKRIERQNRKNSLSKGISVKSGKDQSEPFPPEAIVRAEQPVSFVTNGSDVVNKPADIICQPEVFCQDEDDWSDWEDENKNIHDDWSNLSPDQHVESTHFVPETQNTFYSEDKGPDLWSIDSGVQSNSGITSDDSNSIKSSSVTQQKKVGMSLKGKVKSLKPQPNKPLGSEFDIHSVEIKVTEKKEVDFFADMIPDIKSSNDVMDSVSSQKNPAESSKKSSLFAYDTSDMETKEASGWGDDGWDMEGV